MLPIAIAILKIEAVVIEQSFHLLWKHIAKGRSARLFLFLTRRIDPLIVKSVVLDLRDRIILLPFGGYKLRSILHRVLLRFGKAGLKQIFRRGVARYKEKTAAWAKVFADARK